MMTYILVIWTSVATHSYMGWRPIGEFSTEQSCYTAGHQLEVTKNEKTVFRCLKK